VFELIFVYLDIEKTKDNNVTILDSLRKGIFAPLADAFMALSIVYLYYSMGMVTRRQSIIKKPELNMEEELGLSPMSQSRALKVHSKVDTSGGMDSKELQ